jgi:hypothetical protein
MVRWMNAPIVLFLFFLMQRHTQPTIVFGSPSVRGRSGPRMLFLVDAALLSRPFKIRDIIYTSIIKILCYFNRYVDSRIRWQYPFVC